MRFRFSLRTFLLLVLVAAVLLSPFCVRALRQKQAIGRILAAGGSVLYVQGVKARPGTLVAHWFRPASYIVLRPSQEFPVDTQLQWVTELPRIECLSIEPKHKRDSGLTDAGATLIAEQFNHLKLLKVEQATCSNKRLRQVRDALIATRGWIERPGGWSLQLGYEKSALFQWVEDFRLRDD